MAVAQGEAPGIPVFPAGGAACLSLLLPPSLTPLGMSKAAMKTGCGEGRLLCGDGVKSNPKVECSLIDVNRNIPIE